ncbi:hypothetical protein BC937DRAFT_90538 [Endogone sp. FLAS-F59071]|nr:hypothetical protein BC937DRAFT_90538 [Endogone sp. FLAS-F59071]|eukprot:RUS22064.1 hypothetical protein BC937DRAFT_90538 [Endogone sp. FLAS-F59071]
MKRLETHYGQQLETLQRMHVDKCESILREIDNLRKTNEAFRKQLQRNGIEPEFCREVGWVILTTIPMEYEKHEHGVLNEEHRAFIETAYRAIMLDTTIQEGTNSLLEALYSSNFDQIHFRCMHKPTHCHAIIYVHNHQSTARALDYELKTLKFNHSKLKIEKLQTDAMERNNQPASMFDPKLIQPSVAKTSPQLLHKDIGHPAERSTPTVIGVHNGLNDVARTQRQRAQTIDNFKKAIPSIFLRKSLEKRKDSNIIYDHVDYTEDSDPTASNRRQDRSRRRLKLSGELSDSVDPNMTSSRGRASGVAHQSNLQGTSNEIHVTSSSSCDILSPSKRMFTKPEASISLTNYETSRKFTSANEFSPNPSPVIISRVQTLSSEEMPSNGDIPSTFNRKRRESAPSHIISATRRPSDQRPSRCSSPVPLPSVVADQPVIATVKETSDSNPFVIAELDLPQPTLDFEAAINSKPDLHRPAVKSTESMESTESTESAESTESTESTESSVSTKSAVSTESTVSTESIVSTESTVLSPTLNVSPEPVPLISSLQAPTRSSSTGQSKWAKRKQVLAVLQHKNSGLGLAADFISDSGGKISEGGA